MQIWPVSLKNMLKMYTFLRATKNRLHAVLSGFLFPKSPNCNWQSGFFAVRSGSVVVFFRLCEPDLQTLATTTTINGRRPNAFVDFTLNDKRSKNSCHLHTIRDEFIYDWLILQHKNLSRNLLICLLEILSIEFDPQDDCRRLRLHLKKFICSLRVWNHLQSV